MAKKVLTMQVRVLVGVVVLLLGTIVLSGCGHYVCHTTLGSSTCTPSGGGLSQGGGGTTITQTAFEYFVVDSDAQMSAEGLNVGNDQAFAQISSFATPTLPANQTTDGGMVVVNKSFLYAAFQAPNSVYGFTIDANSGAVTPVTGGASNSPYTVLGANSMATNPAGTLLFVAGSAGITSFSVDSTLGTLTSNGTVATAGLPAQLTTDGKGLYLYAVESGGVYAFSIGSSGALTAVGGPYQTMAQIAGESSGKFIIGITGQDGSQGGVADPHVYFFTISPGGALNIPTAVSTLQSPVYLAVSPNGFAYTFEDDTPDGGVTINIDPMEGFLINSTGLASLSSVSPFTTLLATRGKFDQSGQYLFAEATISGIGGSYALPADTSTGALTSTIPSLGFPSINFAVTDAP